MDNLEEKPCMIPVIANIAILVSIQLTTSQCRREAVLYTLATVVFKK